MPFSTGCKDADTGPKRADHKAAHTAHYHPDVKRESVWGSDDQQAASQPASQPASRPDAGRGPGPVGVPVLFVNNETVTVQDILEPIIDSLNKEAKTLERDAYVASMRRAVRRQIDMHIQTLLIFQEAKAFYPEKAMEMFDKEADKRIKDTINDHFQGIHARYESHLKSMDLTVADIKARVKRQLIVSQFMRDKYKPLLREPPRRLLMKYYQEHAEDFTRPAKAELFLIEIPYESMLSKAAETATSQELATARGKAIDRLARAREELESGVEFAAVAKTYGKGAKDLLGGAWGEISPGALQGRWAKPAEVLFTLKPGEFSELVDTPEAAFIVFCGKRTDPQRQSFEEAQASIIERIKDEQFNKLSQEHVTDLLNKATIRPLQEFAEAVVAAAPRHVAAAVSAKEENSSTAEPSPNTR